MRNVRKKLHSQRGASVVIALIFFLICVMVGAVILAAASANVGRLSHLRKNEQAYFSLSSAARLVRDDLAQSQYRYVTQNNATIAASSGFIGDEPYLHSALEALIRDTCDFPGIPHSKVLTLSFADTDVEATLQMTPVGTGATQRAGAFSLDVALRADNGAAMRLYIPASASTSTETVRTGATATTRTLTTIVYDTGDILRFTSDAVPAGGTP